MDQVARFVGTIPELYDRHLGPVLFDPYARDLVSRLPHGTRRVLEVAAGTGRVTSQLLAALPDDGQLIATDLNEPMMEIGRARVVDPRLSWQFADAQALGFANASFDAVACQFGLMFVPDKSLALREMKRVLRPGGALLLNTWDELSRNPSLRILNELALTTWPSEPPMFLQTPFSLTDPTVLRALAEQAGFRQIQIEAIATIAKASSAAALATGYVRGIPMWNQLVERGVDAAAFEAKVADALAREYGSEPCCSPLSALVMTAFA